MGAKPPTLHTEPRMRDHHPTSTSASPTGRVTPAGRKFGPPGKPAAPAAFAVTGLRPLPPSRARRQRLPRRPPVTAGRGRRVGTGFRVVTGGRRGRRTPPSRRRSPRPTGRFQTVPPAGVEAPSQPSWRWKSDSLPVARSPSKANPSGVRNQRLGRTVASEGVFWRLIGSRS